MKISKNPSQKSKTSANSKVASATHVKTSDYADAQKYIKCAIDALGKFATAKDTKARDSIVNLSVVLLDLQK